MRLLNIKSSFWMFIMLIQFKVSNFCSIQDTQTLSMVAGSGAELEQNTFTIDNNDQLRLLRAAGIYGANAAGKSNILNALFFMRFFIVTWPSDSRAGDPIPVLPFLFNNARFSQPSEFEIHFIKDRIRYQYGFTLNQERVLEEWLFAYPLGKPQKWFSRVYHENKYDWKFSNRFKINNQVSDLTRDNVLFLSTAINFNNAQLTPVFDLFLNEYRFIDLSNNSDLSIRKCALYLQDPETKSLVLSLMNCVDPSISDILIDEHSNDPGADLSSDMSMGDMGKISFIHHGKRLSFIHESAGTKNIFSLVIRWLEILRIGGLVIIDEINNSLHPLLSRFLLGFICNSSINKTNTQLIFTSHDTSLLDNTLLRRDQIWFVEKDKKHATHLYSLTDFSPRKNEAYEKAYLHGRYGAVPHIDEWKF